MKAKDKGREGKSAVEILEEATRLLRANPLLLAPYFFGSLPFILGLLYFWADMSAGADAWRHCAPGAWGLAALFIWMKTWQSLYARRVAETIKGERPSPWGIRRILRAAAIQTAVQPWGFLVLPLALVITLPFPHAFAFFQNVTLFGSGEEGDLPAVLRRSWRQASLWPLQNILIIWLTSPLLLALAALLCLALIPMASSFNPGSSISILFIAAAAVMVPVCPLGVVTAFNLGFALFLAPWLLKTLFNIETTFSMSGTAVLNSTFFAVVCGLTYLCLDPLLKASYCLRCFHGEALKTGEDLAVELARPERKRPAARSVLFALLFVFGAAGFSHAEPGKDSPSEFRVSAGDLDSAIDRVIQSPEYAWRLPRERPPKDERPGLMHEFLASIFDGLGKMWDSVGRGLKRAWDFIEELLSRMIPSLPKAGKQETDWTPYSRALAFVPVAAIAAIL
ncbi:MAG TPA: hypothetical protein VLS90_18410, partial [Thermodesulfobacteriota bacterium]|nr:hypothetical protein [Thermodesulfobacteriota bacterium]